MAGIAETKRLVPWKDFVFSSTMKKDGKHELAARVKMTEADLKKLAELDAKKLANEKPVQLSARDLKGHKVMGANDKGLAEVDDVVLDVLAGRVNYVVFGKGGFLELGEKHYPVPFAKLMLTREANGDLRVATKLDKAMLEKAPEFDPDHWDKMLHVEWVQNLYTHFGCETYWPSARPTPAG